MISFYLACLLFMLSFFFSFDSPSVCFHLSTTVYILYYLLRHFFFRFIYSYHTHLTALHFILSTLYSMTLVWCSTRLYSVYSSLLSSNSSLTSLYSSHLSSILLVLLHTFLILLHTLWQAKYTKIANANVEALEKAGSETLNAAFDKFFKIACEGAWYDGSH